MQKMTINRKVYLLILILVLSVFLTAMEASAARKRITKDGGSIEIAPGVTLVIPEGAIEGKPVSISAKMYWRRDTIEFDFGPSPMSFIVRLRLRIDWEVIESMNLDDFILYSPNGNLLPSEEKALALVWKIKHFSLYYCRRR